MRYICTGGKRVCIVNLMIDSVNMEEIATSFEGGLLAIDIAIHGAQREICDDCIIIEYRFFIA